MLSSIPIAIACLLAHPRQRKLINLVRTRPHSSRKGRASKRAWTQPPQVIIKRRALIRRPGLFLTKKQMRCLGAGILVNNDKGNQLRQKRRPITPEITLRKSTMTSLVTITFGTQPTTKIWTVTSSWVASGKCHKRSFQSLSREGESKGINKLSIFKLRTHNITFLPNCISSARKNCVMRLSYLGLKKGWYLRKRLVS